MALVAAVGIVTLARDYSRAQAAESANTVGDLIAGAYGVPNAIVKHSTCVVGLTPVNCTVNDAGRFADVFSDLGTSSCDLAHSNQVSTTFGFPLAVNGVISENWRDDMVLPTLEMWAVCGAAAQKIDVLELDLH